MCFLVNTSSPICTSMTSTCPFSFSADPLGRGIGTIASGAVELFCVKQTKKIGLVSYGFCFEDLWESANFINLLILVAK